MKKIITSIVLVIFVTVYLQACKKSTDVGPQLTTLQKLQAKWLIVTDLENDHYTGVDHIRNSTGGPNDYVDFRTDGKVYVSAFGYLDTSVYTLSGDTKIIISSTYGSPTNLEIKTLTYNSCTLYQKDISGADFYEETMTLKK